MSMAASAQENLQKQASNKEVEKVFTTVKELPITSVKNQYQPIPQRHLLGLRHLGLHRKRDTKEDG